MALAASIGAVGSVLGGLLGDSGGTSVKDSIALAQAQNKIQKEYDKWHLTNIEKAQLLNTAQWQRQGYERAGFNPILTYMNGISNFSNAGQVGMPVASKDNKGQTISNAINTAIGNYTNARQAESNIALQAAQTANVNADTDNKIVDIGLKKLDKQDKELDIMMKQKDVSWQEQRWAFEQKERNALIRKNLMDADSNQIAANAQKLSAETNAEWTPKKVGTGLALGALGAAGAIYGPAKFKVLKALGKIPKVGF